MTISPPLAGATVGTWTLDPAATTVTVSVKKLGLFTVSADLTVLDGQIEIDADGSVTGVSVQIDATSYRSPNDKRNEHVRGADFLDADNHPVLAFRADNIAADGTHYAVSGTVQVKGAESAMDAVVRDVEIQGDTAKFSLTAALDRTAIGVDKLPSIIVGNRLQLAVAATAHHQSAG
ncbi:MAG: YceI family protein [Actinomycetota bacterium]